MSLNLPNADELRGQLAVDRDRREIGRVQGVYLDNDTRRPEWAAVRLSDTALTIVPLQGASLAPGGVRVAVARDRVLAAPYRHTELARRISEDEEAALYRYYSGATARRGGARSAAAMEAERAGALAEEAVSGARRVGQTAKSGAEAVATTVARQTSEVAEEAKDQVTSVADTVRAQAGSVAATAKEQTAAVAEQVTTEAQDLLAHGAERLEAQAETQLEQVAEAMHRLAGQALALVRGNPDMAGRLPEVVARAGREVQSAARRIEDKGAKGLLGDAQRLVAQRPNAAIFGTAAVVMLGSRLAGTPLGEKAKEALAPLREQAVEAGRSVAEELKSAAQDRVEQVKTTATEAAAQIRQEAQASAEEVKEQAKTSTAAVKDTAKTSAGTVKATTKRSAKAVKGVAQAKAATGGPPARRRLPSSATASTSGSRR